MGGSPVSFSGLLVRDVTLSRAVAGTVDRYGNTPNAFGTDDEMVKGWLSQTSRAENVDGREAQIEETVLFLAPGTDVEGVDRVSVSGVAYNVVGPPHRAWTPRGEHHVELSLRAATG